MGIECVDFLLISCLVLMVFDENNESCVVGVDFILFDFVVFFVDDEVILFYNCISDDVYEGYWLYLWNNDDCDFYVVLFDVIDWVNGYEYDGIDFNYGVYWIVKLKEGYNECVNFIVYIGIEGFGKVFGDVDLKMLLM